MLGLPPGHAQPSQDVGLTIQQNYQPLPWMERVVPRACPTRCQSLTAQPLPSAERAAGIRVAPATPPQRLFGLQFDLRMRRGYGLLRQHRLNALRLQFDLRIKITADRDSNCDNEKSSDEPTKRSTFVSARIAFSRFCQKAQFRNHLLIQNAVTTKHRGRLVLANLFWLLNRVGLVRDVVRRYTIPRHGRRDVFIALPG